MGAKEALIAFVIWVVSGAWSTLITSYTITGVAQLTGFPLLSGVAVMVAAYLWMPSQDARIKELEREVKNLKTQLWVSIESSRYI